MTNFLTAHDLRGLGYIPDNKLEAFVVDLNRIIKSKVAGDDEKAWNDFVAGAVTYKTRTYGKGTETRAQ